MQLMQFWDRGYWSVSYGDKQAEKLLKAGVIERCKHCGLLITKCCGYCHVLPCRAESAKEFIENYSELI